MAKNAKPREVVRDIKEHAVSSAKDKASVVGIKTKDRVIDKVQENVPQSTRNTDNKSPENYATDTVTDTGRDAAEYAADKSGRVIRKGTDKVKEKIREHKANSEEESIAENEPEAPETESATSDTSQDVSSESTDTMSDTSGNDIKTKDNVESEHSEPKDTQTQNPKSERTGQTQNVSSDATEATTDTTGNKIKTKDRVDTKSSDITDSKPQSVKSQKTSDGKPRIDNTVSDSKPILDGGNEPVNPIKNGDNKTQIKEKQPTEIKTADKSIKTADTKPRVKEVSTTDTVYAEKRGEGQKPETKELAKANSDKAKLKDKKAPDSQTAKKNPAKDYKKPKVREQSEIKKKAQTEIKNIKTSERNIKTLNNNGRAIKQGAKGAETAGKSIKTVDEAYKAAEKSAKTAKKTAETAAKTAKRTEEVAKKTAQASVKAAKAVAKAVVETAKAIAAAAKELGALIASGGPVVVIIIVTCLIAAIGGTCYGIFLSNDESTGSAMTMSQAISSLTSEYYAELTAMKMNYTYDEMEIKSLSGDTSLNWKDILAVYAVKNTTAKGDGFEVVTLDEQKLSDLKKIMKDMNKMTSVVTTKVVTENVTTTDDAGNTVTTRQNVTKKILTVTVTRLNANQISELYGFDAEQKKQLNELMNDEYDDLWQSITGGAAGDILLSESSHTPKDMFIWPLQGDGTISSRFGTRADPINGVVKTHGGTDIAAPTGTPILAAADGTVIAATYNEGGYGYYVKIQHANNYATLYGHCSVLHVSAGQTVKQGQVIAEVGSTGHSTGPHCHFEVIKNGVRVDALNYYN